MRALRGDESLVDGANTKEVLKKCKATSKTPLRVPRPPADVRSLQQLAPSQVFGTRLRQARERAGLSQEALATSAGIDEFSASARISQYETGKHTPRYEIACRLADVLGVPVPFLYCLEEKTAEMLLIWHNSKSSARQHAIEALATG